MLNNKGERALVYLSNVDELHEITFLNQQGNLEVCQNIERLVTKGWNLVVQKSRFNVNELFVYCETDCILDKDTPLFAFLEGKRIRTKKLKGVVSQGVAFTIPEMLQIAAVKSTDEDFNTLMRKEWELGDDWTELVGATKYDEYSNNGRKSDGVKLPPSHARGNFPSFIHKTDEERIQNLAKELKYDWQGKEVVITEKVDGSSITIYHKVEDIHEWPQVFQHTYGICSRNLDLKLDSTKSHFIKTGFPYMVKLGKYCSQYNRSLALQGEIIGPGIQGNPYKLDKHEIYFFNVFDIDAGKRLTHDDAMHIICQLGEDIQCVPLVNVTTINCDMQTLLNEADGLSVLNAKTNREGIVVRALDGSFSFKVISNKWLLKEKE